MAVLGLKTAIRLSGCCGAVLGTSILTSAAQPVATGSRATTGTSTSVFVWSAPPRGLFRNPLPSCSFALCSFCFPLPCAKRSNFFVMGKVLSIAVRTLWITKPSFVRCETAMMSLSSFKK